MDDLIDAGLVVTVDHHMIREPWADQAAVIQSPPPVATSKTGECSH
jgi:hypothetical protein